MRESCTDVRANPHPELHVGCEPYGNVDVLAAAGGDRLAHTQVFEDAIRRALAVLLAAQGHHRHAHVERFESTVYATVRKRIERKVDHVVARLVFLVVAALRQQDDALQRDVCRVSNRT